MGCGLGGGGCVVSVEVGCGLGRGGVWSRCSVIYVEEGCWHY